MSICPRVRGHPHRAAARPYPSFSATGSGGWPATDARRSVRVVTRAGPLFGRVAVCGVAGPERTMLLCLVKGSNGGVEPRDESGDVCLEVVESVGAGVGEEERGVAVVAEYVESFEEVFEELGEFDGVERVDGDGARERCPFGCASAAGAGAGQGSATGEGKLLRGHGVPAADAGGSRRRAGGSFSGQPEGRQPIIEPGPRPRELQPRGRCR
jgi:hypothetical protein